MNAVDRLLQRWRIRKAAAWLPRGGRVLDIGCDDGALARQLPWLGEYVGLDPFLEHPGEVPNGRILRGRFPEDLPDGRPFDAITMLAVFEHLTPEEHGPLTRACAAALKPGGRLVMTVPSPAVDQILHVLQFLRVLDGMSVEEHHGLDVRRTPTILTAEGHLRLVKARRFQFGLNHLFVFERP